MNKIGSVKVVDGFTFTLVEKEKFVYMVEITKEDDVTFSELKTVGHNTWKKGVFTKVLRELNPQPKKVKEKKERTPREMKTKTINGVEFRVVEKNRETKRVVVVADGFEGTHEMSLGTWYRGRFYKNAMKHLRRLVDRIVSYLPALITEKPINTDELHDLKNICDVRELKKEYRRLARKFHPDNLDTGNTEQFKLVKTIYEVRTEAIESALEIFNMLEDTFVESFDGWKGYTEEKIKEELNESKDECFKDYVDNEEQFLKGIYNIQY